MIHCNYKYVTEVEQVRDYIAKRNKTHDYIVLDTETTSKDPHRAELVDVQLSITDDTVIMFPGKLCHLLANIQVVIVGVNLKYDFIVLHRTGVDLQSKEFFDLMLVDHLIDENQSHSMQSMLKRAGIPFAFKQDFWDKYKNYLDAPFEVRLKYACTDIMMTDMLYKRMKDAAAYLNDYPSGVRYDKD
jgi:DNA polymerase I-like protein with 3'-5' exonuclease and polymerase domains